MLQLSVLRQNAGWVKEKLGIKNFADINAVDVVIGLDEQIRDLKVKVETAQANMNSITKEIGALMAKGQKEDAEQKKLQVLELKNYIQPI